MGATSVEQLVENLGAWAHEPLSDEILREIDAIHVVRRNPSLVD